MYRYIKKPTLAENQKISWIRSRTGGRNNSKPISPRTTPNPARPIVCKRKYGCLGMRNTPTKAISPRRRKVIPASSENTKSHVPPLNRCGNGRSHPPSHSVTAMDETAIIAEYSARKNNDQRKPLYSVWNPAVNSDSASGRSKGARLVSATMETAKIKNAMNPNGKNLKMNQ